MDIGGSITSVGEREDRDGAGGCIAPEAVGLFALLSFVDVVRFVIGVTASRPFKGGAYYARTGGGGASALLAGGRGDDGFVRR